jgi:hypothetical protein
MLPPATMNAGGWAATHRYAPAGRGQRRFMSTSCRTVMGCTSCSATCPARAWPIDVQATGTPIGMFCESQFSTTRLRLDVGQTMLIYSDGLTEATDESGAEYGSARVQEAARRYASADLGESLDAQLAAHPCFRSGTPNVDYLALLAIRRLEPSQHVELVSAVDRRRWNLV